MPGCFNPDHLQLGTQKENMEDAVARGRSLFGERNPSAKLGDAEVIEIYHSAEDDVALGKRFDLWPYQIRLIKSGGLWGRVTGHQLDV